MKRKVSKPKLPEGTCIWDYETFVDIMSNYIAKYKNPSEKEWRKSYKRNKKKHFS